MLLPSRQFLVLIATLIVAGVGVALYVARSSRSAELSFWFETMSEDAMKTLPARLPGAISPNEMKVIETISRDEIVAAFRDYPVSVVGRAPGLYHVRVIDSASSSTEGAAESYVLPGVGGQGFINFRSLAHNAVLYAPPDADRRAIVAAIGRGIGRAAVHEFTHQLLGRGAPIDRSTDIQSYEYGSADRREQYYGPMRWDIAEPMLRKRFAPD